MIYDPNMSREDPQMKLRMPADLKACIEEAAEAAGRSMNAEIVARLQASFQAPPAGTPSEAWEDQARQLMQARRAAASAGVALVNALAELKRLGCPDELCATWQEAALAGAMQAISMLPTDLAELEDFARRVREGKALPPWMTP